MSERDDADGDAGPRNVYLYIIVGMVLLFVVFMLGGQLVEVL